jgi:hypothetical protein
MNVSINEWFHKDECHFTCMNFICDLNSINQSMDEIHPILENK